MSAHAAPLAPARFRFVLALLFVMGALAVLGVAFAQHELKQSLLLFPVVAFGLALLLGSWNRQKGPFIALCGVVGVWVMSKPFLVPIDCSLFRSLRWCTVNDFYARAFLVTGGIFIAMGIVLAVIAAWRSRPKPARAPDATERIIEMTWRCSTCATANLGRHKACPGCGHPKDPSEKFEMPANPSQAASVTEASLLRMALAGPDWRCAWCDSDQRADDGRCRNCGADPPEEAKPVVPGVPAYWSTRALGVAGALALAAAVGGTVAGWLDRDAPSFIDREVRLQSARWVHSVTVSAKVAIESQGFEEKRPNDAFDVRVLGKRVHHSVLVCDRSGTERYSVQVEDGYREERYRERVQCGETCTSVARSCSEKCTTLANGFASCKQVCTGGGRSCTPKYCSETRTRRIPRTKSVDKTRVVCRESHQMPVEQDWLTWKRWGWRTVRELKTEGESTEPRRWPSEDEIALDAEERAYRSERLVVTFVDPAGKKVDYEPTAQEFATLVRNRTYWVRSPRTPSTTERSQLLTDR